jgi:hypothetical protein
MYTGGHTITNFRGGDILQKLIVAQGHISPLYITSFRIGDLLEKLIVAQGHILTLYITNFRSEDIFDKLIVLLHSNKHFSIHVNI